MSISKLCSGRPALSQWQQQYESVEIPRNDELHYNLTNPKGATQASAAICAIITSSSGSSSVGRHLSSPVSANNNSNNTQLNQRQQQQQLQTQLQQQPQQTYLPQTSLLKIRPFVPSLNTRIRRPIGRSYSTLSSTFTRRITATNTAQTITTNVQCTQGATRNELVTTHSDNVIVGAAIDRNTVLSKASRAVNNVHRQTIKVIKHQRSKSTSSSAISTTTSNRPATSAIKSTHTAPITSATPTTCTLITPQPNGICRISRLPREQEKLPDRINYDRRGLTAIPIFENETNLRLLSLQHNLINVFHIPKEEQCTHIGPLSPADGSQTTIQQPSNRIHNGHSRRHFKTNNNNSSIRSIPATQPSQSPTNSSTDPVGMTILLPASTPSPPIHATFNDGRPVSQLLKRNNLLQNLNLNASHMLSPQQQQQQQRQSHYRFAMKKSKSFINNYTRQMNSAKRSAPKPTLNKADSKMLLLFGRTNLKSFDSTASGLTNDSTQSTIVTSEFEEEDAYEQQLEIKNKQLTPSYGFIFQNLVFLDLYDNQIERIANLDGLPMLSVLLLGKNRITDISGLVSLRDTLRVLDLHGNKITSISNKINCLQGLKSLNLAGNQIRQINQNDFNGLQNLKELNLKRNRIRRINGFQHLISLERLWLCHNDLHKVEDMSSIAKATSLLEVTIENNPVSLAGDCVSFLVSYLPNLQSLSQMPITEQVRKAALAWRKNKELSEANYAHHSIDVFNSIRREEVISNARTNWELLRSQQTMQATLRIEHSPKHRELTKINESNEIAVAFEDLQEYIKLPPIQQQTLGQCQQELKINEQQDIDNQSRSSNSSLGPNVDSSSSSYSSDNEDSLQKNDSERVEVKKVYIPASLKRKKSGQCKYPREESVSPLKSKAKDENSHDDTFDTTTSQLHEKKTDGNDGTTIDCNNDENRSPTKQTTINGTNATESPKMNDFSDTTLLSAQNQQQILVPSPLSGKAINSSIICLGYNPESTAVLSYDGTPVSSFSIATTLISTVVTTTSSLMTTVIGTGASTPTMTTTITTTTPTSTTCKRYMRSSLMRSQVVVGSIGSYNSSSTSGPIGGKLRLTKKSNVNLMNGQSTSSIPIATSTPTIVNATARTPSPAPTGVSVSGNHSPITSNNTSQSHPISANASATVSTTAGSLAPAVKLTALEREREQGGDYLIEICGRYLNIYGQGALRFIDKQWNPTKANDVHTLNFSYINFNNIVSVLARIKVRFPHAENFVFRETNISCLGQLNALAELQGISSLFIDHEGNAITAKNLWRQYAIYRLSHWGLKLLNATEISPTEIDEANEMYTGLSDLVLWSMPDVMLHPLLARLRLDETCTASKMSPKDWLMKAENKPLRIVVGKEALQWKKPNINATTGKTGTIINNLGQQYHHYPLGCLSQQQQQSHNLNDLADEPGATGIETTFPTPNSTGLNTRERGKIHFTMMMENTCNAVEKLQKLETLWPSLLLDIVRNTLLDYSQLDAYLRNLMGEIMK